jgi:nitrite reductase/ring-hydroxylating ferredoxin subunit
MIRLNADEIKEGQAKVVSINGEDVAVFRHEGGFYAIQHICPHRGGPLGEGQLEGSVVTCPWHGWKFDIKTGVSPVMPTARVKTYKVHVEGNEVCIED